MPLTPEELATLAALADGIIPPDQIDAGASAVNAGARIADRVASGVNAKLYLAGLAATEVLARKNYRRATRELETRELHDLIGVLRDESPGFFKQLRMDVCSLYLSGPDVWKRIGFPGPSIASGGYPDFDQPQKEKITRLKEPKI